jgi:hypothetical protein
MSRPMIDVRSPEVQAAALIAASNVLAPILKAHADSQKGKPRLSPTQNLVLIAEEILDAIEIDQWRPEKRL